MSLGDIPFLLEDDWRDDLEDGMVKVDRYQSRATVELSFRF